MRKRLLTAVLAVLLSAAVAAPASARTYDVTDASGDLMTATFTGPNDEDPTYGTSSDADGDVVFARFQHTATQVILYTRYRELYVPTQYAGFFYRVQGNNGALRDIQLLTRHGAPQGTASMTDDNDKVVRCSITHTVNYSTNSATIRFPRSCLRTPKYVRLGHVSYRQRVNASSEVVTYDDPTRTGGTLEEAASTPTPWLVTG